MRKHSFKVAAALSVLLLASAIVVASVESPEFSLAASPSGQTITPNQLARYTVDVRSLDGFSGEVLLGCHPNSPLISCRVMPNVVHICDEGCEIPTPEILMVAWPGGPAAGIATGKYSIQITGNALPIAYGDTQGTNRTTVSLTVLPIVGPPNE